MFCVFAFQGASILLMLNAFLPGNQQFRKGIIHYLKQFSGSNTETVDLWNSLTQVHEFEYGCFCIIINIHQAIFMHYFVK